jgi:hypothetical protein
MSESSVIREFLVGLGFKVDEQGLKKFNDGVTGTTASVTKFAIAIGTTALAVGKMVASVSKDFDDLYFSAKKAGSSAESMQALGQAAESFGVSASAAKASAHSLFMTLQKNPGTEGIFKSLGIQTRDAKGQLLDTEKLMMGFFAKAKNMPTYLAYQYGGMLGISDDMLQAGMQDGFTEKELKRRLEAGSANSAAQSGHNEQEHIRDAQAEYLKWLEKVNGQLPPFVKEIGSFLGVMASFVSGPVWTAITAVAGLKLLGIGSGGAAAGSAAAGAGRGVLARGAAAAGSLAMRAGVGIGLMAHTDDLNTGEDAELEKRRALGATITTPGAPRGTPAQQTMPDTGVGGGRGRVNRGGFTSSPSSYPGGTRGIRNNNPGNLNFANQNGATKEGGPNGRFAVFGSAEDGLRALIRQIDLYAARGITSVEGIINKWAPASENNTKAYIERVAKTLGVDPTKPIDMSDIRIRTGIMKSIIGVENGRNPYSDEMVARAAGGVQIAQNTTINVNGASDPVSTAQAVAAAQNSVNANTMRNASNRVQ